MKTIVKQEMSGSPDAVRLANGRWQAFIERVRGVFQVPVGYEDETGFHYGIRPISSDAEILRDRKNLRDRGVNLVH